MADGYVCCVCGGPAAFGCAECCNTFCDASGCTAVQAKGTRWYAPVRTIHTHGALWAMQPIEPIPDDRVFKTGPLMRATPPPREKAAPTSKRLDLDSPSSVLEWMDRERGGVPVRPRRTGRQIRD